MKMQNLNEGRKDDQLIQSKPLVSVFIAEDHEVTRFGIKAVIESNADFKLVGEAADGKLAYRDILASNPDVVLMDIGLPSIDGIELSRKVKSAAPQIKILVFTSRESSDQILAAFAAGADGYCLKEASNSQLHIAIKTVADGGVWLHPAIARVLVARCIGPAGQSGQTNLAQHIPYEVLSVREHEVLRLIVDGLSNQEIAERLVVSLDTVKTHVRHIFEKLAVNDRTQAALKAVRAGWVG
jgi:DNA-binding NarL/FixJ family response regulator